MANETLGTLRSWFPGYFDFSQVERRKVYRTGLVVPDTNILLDLYRFRDEARGQMFEALEACEQRLFIPHRVSQEFLGSRIGVIQSRATETKRLLGDIDRARDDAINTMHSARQTAALPVSEVDAMAARLRTAMQAAKSELRDLLDEDHAISPGRPDSEDDVLTRLEGVVDGRVGAPLSDEAMESLRVDAVSRFERKIPPGFKDGDKDFERAIGDLVLWRQVLLAAQDRGLPVLVVTGDTKQDWVRRDGTGKPVGPHPLLVQEMSDVAGVDLIWADAPLFLAEAKDFLSVRVSARTIDESRQVGKVDEVRTARRVREARQIVSLDLDPAERKRRARSVEHLLERSEDLRSTVDDIDRQLSESVSEAERLRLQHHKDHALSQLVEVESLIDQLAAQLAVSSSDGRAGDPDGE